MARSQALKRAPSIGKRQPVFQVGDRVQWKGLREPGRIDAIEILSGDALYSLDYGKGPLFWALEEDLTLFADHPDRRFTQAISK